MKVFFLGAGPGDPDLITVKGKKLLTEAAVVIFAGSLVNPEILEWSRPHAELHDSAGMTLDQVLALYSAGKERCGIIVRLHTGDPSVYGAIQEQIDFLRRQSIPYEVVPGVSSFSAAAAALGQEFTLPGVSQSVILSRVSGRTRTPPTEDIAFLAEHRATMVLFLSAGKMTETVEKLKQGYNGNTPVAVVYRASWPDQEIVIGTLDDIATKAAKAGITRQALIIVGEVLRAGRGEGTYELSKLYDSGFTHGYRRGRNNQPHTDSAGPHPKADYTHDDKGMLQ